MPTPVLDDLKFHLRIEDETFDEELRGMLLGAIQEAENVTGRNYTKDLNEDYEDMPHDVFQAVLRIAATSFDSRQDNSVDNSKSVNDSYYTLRQNSKRPMF